MKRSTTIATAVAIAVPLLIYLATLAPSVVLVDSGELALAVQSVAPGHPPGFPLYVLAGQIGKLLPGADLARRLNVLSAICQALAIGVCFRIFVAISGRTSVVAAPPPPREAASRRGKGRKPPPSPPRAPRVASIAPGIEIDRVAASLAAALGLAFARSIWRWAVVTEVYALHLLLLALAILLSLRAAERATTARLFLAGLAMTIASANHLTAILFVPFFLGYVALSLGNELFRPARLAALACGLGAGLLPFLFLPWAAARDPLFNWGDPDNLERFLRHVSGWQYQVNLIYKAGTSAEAARHLRDNLRKLPAVLGRQETFAWVAAGAAGLVVGLRRCRNEALLVATMAIVNAFHAVSYDIAEDWDAYFYPTYILIGLGVALLCARGLASVPPARRAIARAGLAVIVLAPIALNTRVASHHGFTLPTQLVEDTLGTLPQGALVLTREWQFYAPALYLQRVKGYRPDVTVLDAELMRRPWYHRYIARIAPDLAKSRERETEAFLEALVPFERDLPYDQPLLQSLYEEIINGFIAAREGRAYVALDMEPGIGKGRVMVPQGLLFRLEPAMPATPLPQPELRGEATILEGRLPDAEGIGKVVRLYATMRDNRGIFLALVGRPAEARKEWERALLLAPDDENARRLIARPPTPPAR